MHNLLNCLEIKRVYKKKKKILEQIFKVSLKQ